MCRGEDEGGSVRGAWDERRADGCSAARGSSLLFRLRFGEFPRRSGGAAAVWIPPVERAGAPWLRGGDGTPADVRGPVRFLQ